MALDQINLDFIIDTDNKSSKSQFLYLANELSNLGLVNDSINGISVFHSGTSVANFFKNKI